MFQGADDLLAYVKDEGVEFIDIRFCDLPGIMQHFTVPVGTFGPEYSRTESTSTARRFAASRRSMSRTWPCSRSHDGLPRPVPDGEDLSLLRSRPADQGAVQPRPAQHCP